MIFYGVLCLLCLNAFHGKYGFKTIIYLALGCFLYGIFLEIMQVFATKSRFFEVLDIVSNGIGVFFASLGYSMFKKKSLWIQD